jgi:hypothetical protein
VKRHLFSSGNLSEALIAQEMKLMDRINRYSDDDFPNMDISDEATRLVEEFSYKPPTILKDDASIDPPPHTAPANADAEWTIHVPIMGDANLLWYRANTFTYNPPYVEMNGNDLALTVIKSRHEDEGAFSKRITSQLDELAKEIGWTEAQVKAFNDSLPQKVKNILDGRRTCVLKNLEIGAKLPIKLRRRSDAPQTYITPVVKRKITPTLPSSTGAKQLEPTLEMSEYEHILHIISRMAEVMERSPKAFVKIGEEDLRTHFLVQLNGQYEGQATGETFNLEGDTDILVRDRERVIFIAECKYWGGGEKHKATIDQLLGYLTWRDSKAAIIIFNRNKGFTNMVSQMIEATKEHPSFVRTVEGYKTESGFRCIIRNKNDQDREIILTAMAFDIPTATPEKSA